LFEKFNLNDEREKILFIFGNLFGKNTRLLTATKDENIRTNSFAILQMQKANFSHSKPPKNGQ
jgi:hypothetical protein